MFGSMIATMSLPVAKPIRGVVAMQAGESLHSSRGSLSLFLRNK